MMKAILGVIVATVATIAPCCAGETAAPPTSGVTVLPSASGVNLTFARGGPVDGILLSGAGPLISYCPQLACVVVPNADHQRAAALFAARTQDDGHSEEQTVAIETTVVTGYLRRWSPSTAYARGDNVSFSDGRNAVYRATKAGTSAAGGTGPSGKGDVIADGSIVWQWINDAAISGKVGLYNEVAVERGGGASWGQANNVHLQPGSTPTFNVNTELDFANDAADCTFGAANCVNLLVSSGGSHRSTTGLYVVSDNAGTDALHWGIRVAGDHLASDEDIEDDAAAPVGIGLGLFGGKAHSRAGIQDGSSGAVSFLVTGDHTVATIEDRSSSPASLSIGGAHALAGIVEQSRSQNGIMLQGHYDGAQIAGSGFTIDRRGAIVAASVQADQIVAPMATPPSSSAPCKRGQITFDETYLYMCVRDNVWRRTQSSAF